MNISEELSELQQKVLYEICVYGNVISEREGQITSTEISRVLKISKYKSLKTLKELEEKGLVRRTSYFYSTYFEYYGDIVEQFPPLKTWIVTKKSTKTEIFKKAYEYVRKEEKRIFGFETKGYEYTI